MAGQTAGGRSKAPAASEETRDLVARAVRRAMTMYGRIYPCGDRASVFDCYTLEGDTVYLWFNSEDRSTHVVEEAGGTPGDEKGTRWQ